MLGMRESYEDWQALGRDLMPEELLAPMLVVADGAPGWSRQSSSAGRPLTASAAACTARATSTPASRARARAPQRANWQALDDAINERDAKRRLQALVDQLKKAAFIRCGEVPGRRLDALVVHLRYPPRHRRRWRSTNLLERILGEVKRGTKVMGGSRRGQLPHARLGSSSISSSL